MAGLNDFIIVKTTYPDLTAAKQLAQILLQNRLAACVQLSQINSLYFWQEKIEDEQEILVSIKSKKSLFAQIEKIIKKHHKYDLPQIVSISIDQGSSEYLSWLNSQLEKS